MVAKKTFFPNNLSLDHRTCRTMNCFQWTHFHISSQSNSLTKDSWELLVSWREGLFCFAILRTHTAPFFSLQKIQLHPVRVQSLVDLHCTGQWYSNWAALIAPTAGIIFNSLLQSSSAGINFSFARLLLLQCRTTDSPHSVYDALRAMAWPK